MQGLRAHLQRENEGLRGRPGRMRGHRRGVVHKYEEGLASLAGEVVVPTWVKIAPRQGRDHHGAQVGGRGKDDLEVVSGRKRIQWEDRSHCSQGFRERRLFKMLDEGGGRGWGQM